MNDGGSSRDSVLAGVVTLAVLVVISQRWLTYARSLVQLSVTKNQLTVNSVTPSTPYSQQTAVAGAGISGGQGASSS